MKNIRSLNKIGLLLLVLGLLAACAGPDKSPVTGTKAVNQRDKDLLTQREAQLRFQQIESPHYELWITMDNSNLEFSGRAKVNFVLKEKVTPSLRLDFTGGTVEEVIINGNPAEAVDVSTAAIWLNTAQLKVGLNTVEIHYRHPFSNEGTGLHRFQDPEDGNVYVYSHLEPYHAHLIFPCFDQPDLRATWDLTVQAPVEWTVVSNNPPSQTEEAGTFKKWSFTKLSPLPTYLFALIGGPYSSWSAKAGTIPMSVYSRKSLAKYVDYQNWFDVTAFGLEFFQKKFGTPYPFQKYDQIIVPDFNAGAMENAGAVTFSERSIYRSKVTDDTRRGRANTILHEMAHMWFGDLVTMRWWNGLWLNESFASYMASYSLHHYPKFKGAWKDFFAGTKQWAYWEDQLVTTHPIEGEVADTSQTLTQFDGITYGKGASVLKLLNFWIGDDKFFEGLKIYFKKHAWGNTEISDFFAAMAQASQKDLTGWQNTWLKTTGVNRLEARWSCDDSQMKISDLALIQGTPETNSELRPHKTKLGLIYVGSNSSIQIKSVETEYFGAETLVSQALDLPCPTAVLPNYEDYDYAKVVLDSKSLKFFASNLKQIREGLVRQMIWHVLWEMTRDGIMPAQDYLETVFRHLDYETDSAILSWVLRTTHSSRVTTTTAMKLVTPNLQAQYLKRLETFERTGLAKATPGSDIQLLWFQHLLQVLHSAQGQKDLLAWLQGQMVPRGLKMEQERRWEIIQTLSRLGEPSAPQLILAESQADQSDQGKRQAIIAEVMLPDTTVKQKWARWITKRPESTDGTPPRLSLLSQAMRNFFVSGQESQWDLGTSGFFESLPRLTQSESEEFLGRFARDFYPGLCDPNIASKTTQFLESDSKLSPVLVKALKVQRQEDQRCVKARQTSQLAKSPTPKP